MAAYLAKVLNSAPLQRRYAPHLKLPIEVKDGRRCRHAIGDYHWIKIPKFARSAYIVLHEAAHSLTDRKHGWNRMAAHGAEYAAIYLDLVRFGMGKAAHDALLASFKAHKVKYRVAGGRAQPVHTRRVAFQATTTAVKPKAPKTTTRWQKECAQARRALGKLAAEHGFTFKVEPERGVSYGWFETDTFPVSGLGFTTMHYDWPTTLDRVQRCIADPTLLDEDGGFSE